jgi:hypothetical protein
MTFDQILSAQHYLKNAQSQMAKKADNSAAEFSALSTALAVVTINLQLMIQMHELPDKNDSRAIMRCFGDFMTATNNTN